MTLIPFLKIIAVRTEDVISMHCDISTLDVMMIMLWQHSNSGPLRNRPVSGLSFGASKQASHCTC